MLKIQRLNWLPSKIFTAFLMQIVQKLFIHVLKLVLIYLSMSRVGKKIKLEKIKLVNFIENWNLLIRFWSFSKWKQTVKRTFKFYIENGYFEGKTWKFVFCSLKCVKCTDFNAVPISLFFSNSCCDFTIIYNPKIYLIFTLC